MISVLIPTRGRPNLLENSINSLISKDNNCEIILGIDNDDLNTIAWADSHKHSYVLFERLGYKKLHVYYNTLAEKATGSQLLVWNDDCEMLTNNWATKLQQYSNYMLILRMTVVNHPHPFALFPVVPKKWLDLFGHLSPTAQVDRFIYEVCASIKPMPMYNVDVQCSHHRFDLTGKNKDSTYEEREYMEGDPSNPEHIDSPINRKRIIDGTAKLVEFLQTNGIKLS